MRATASAAESPGSRSATPMARWTVSPKTFPNRLSRSFQRAPASSSAWASTRAWAWAEIPRGAKRGLPAAADASAQSFSTAATSAFASLGFRAGGGFTPFAQAGAFTGVHSSYDSIAGESLPTRAGVTNVPFAPTATGRTRSSFARVAAT